LFWSS